MFKVVMWAQAVVKDKKREELFILKKSIFALNICEIKAFYKFVICNTLYLKHFLDC